MRYSLIYADPPWPYNDRKNARTRFGLGAQGHYPLMSEEEIRAVPVKAVSAKDSALLLWVTWPRLPMGLRVMEAWGFGYRTVGFVWVKLNPGRARLRPEALAGELQDRELWPFLRWLRFFGVGNYSKSNTEPCLLGVRGRMPPASHKVSQVVFAPRSSHSCKPPEVRDRIVELFGDLPRLELFAREAAAGWDAWGDQVEGSIALPTYAYPVWVPERG